MSAWSGRHFRSPYLAATVGLGAGAGEIELRHGSRIGSVEIAGDLGAAMALFAGLADPASAVWRDVSQNGGAHLQSLVGDLDRLGWLRDADESGRDRRDEHAARLDNTLVQASRLTRLAARARFGAITLPRLCWVTAEEDCDEVPRSPTASSERYLTATTWATASGTRSPSRCATRLR